MDNIHSIAYRRRLLPPRRHPTATLLPALDCAFETTPKECAQVRRILAKAAQFPPEIVDIVMDLAEYWACSVTSVDYSNTANGELDVLGSSGPNRNENKFVLRTEPLGLTAWQSSNDTRALWLKQAPPRKLVEEYSRKEFENFIDGPLLGLAHPFRKVVFDIVSRDQGWGGGGASRNSFRSSWTWFDAGIDRFDKGHTCSTECVEGHEDRASNASEKAPSVCAVRPVWPSLDESLSNYSHELLPTAKHRIQCNRVAVTEWQRHHVEWSWTDNIDAESSAGEELDENGRGAGTGDGSFVRNLKVGDMITVWARARFPGWVNKVKEVHVRVYWAV
ncbi:hypothetical protein GGR50DRAFT_377946 [Xylaria sp. CBS 124048]|nr:hypothetical protein GGR50DRAFT_377946 [Xylaria sp. CBS 124048]